MIQPSKTWLVLSDKDLEPYVKEKKINTYDFSEKELRHIKKILQSRKGDLVEIQNYLDKKLRDYDKEFEKYLSLNLEN